MRAILQFIDYHVLETIYRLNLSFSDEEMSLEPKIMYTLEVNPDSIKQAVIGLGVEIGNADMEDSPFYVKAKILGRFSIESEELSEQEILTFYKKNGTAILFPYLRSLVSDLTSKGSESPVILPTMNVSAMIDDSEKDQSNND